MCVCETIRDWDCSSVNKILVHFMYITDKRRNLWGVCERLFCANIVVRVVRCSVQRRQRSKIDHEHEHYEHYRSHDDSDIDDDDDDDDVDNVCKYVYSVPAILYIQRIFPWRRFYSANTHSHTFAPYPHIHFAFFITIRCRQQKLFSCPARVICVCFVSGRGKKETEMYNIEWKGVAVHANSHVA